MRAAFVLAVALLAPAVALADVDPRFAKLRDSAEKVGGLGTFIAQYVRKPTHGKSYYMIVTEDAADMVSFGAYNPEGEFTLNVTPFFAAGGSAVSHGAPKRTDSEGNPIFPVIAVKGVTPEGWNAQQIARFISTRQVRVQVVFSPEGVWKLPKKGVGTIEGVKARIDALLITVGRTGDVLGLWINPKR